MAGGTSLVLNLSSHGRLMSWDGGMLDRQSEHAPNRADERDTPAVAYQALTCRLGWEVVRRALDVIGRFGCASLACLPES